MPRTSVATPYGNFAPVARSFGEPFARSLAEMSLEEREATILEACRQIEAARQARAAIFDRSWLFDRLSPERDYRIAHVAR